MERADWLQAGFSSPAWGEQEIRSLHAELTEIDRSAAQLLAVSRGFAGDPGGPSAGQYGLYRRAARRWGQEAA
jgi:hypothetical protein